MTDDQVLEYRNKLNDEAYMNMAINKIAGKETLNKDVVKKERVMANELTINTNDFIGLNNRLFQLMDSVIDKNIDEAGMKQKMKEVKMVIGISKQINDNYTVMLDAIKWNDAATGAVKLPEPMMDKKEEPKIKRTLIKMD